MNGRSKIFFTRIFLLAVKRFDTKLFSRLNIMIIIFNFLLILITFNLLQTQTWKDIVPLKSTEADVERILGKPLPQVPNKKIGQYETKNEKVTITYSAGTCQNPAGDDNVYNIPPRTVLSIDVYPKQPPKLADYQFDKSKFKTSRVGDVGNFTDYWMRNEGFEFLVDNDRGVIVTFASYAKPKDAKALKCKK
jgi:hypothetical protein